MKTLSKSEVELVYGGNKPGPCDDPYHFQRKGSAGPFPVDSGPVPSATAPNNIIPDSALIQRTQSAPPDSEAGIQSTAPPNGTVLS